MNSPRLLLFALGLLTGLFSTVLSGAAGNESKQIREHIDALLKRRQKPEPLPVDPPNPFALASGSSGLTLPVHDQAPITTVPSTPVAVGDKAEEEPGSATTAELLARLAARLRITGTIRVKNQLNIIINDNPWKEGDFLIINQGARILRLQVARIQPGQLTLRLKDAEMVLKF